MPAGAGITVGSGATVTVTGTSAGAKGAVYVVNDTGFSNLGTINGTVAMEDVANEYTVTLKDSNGQVVNIFNMSAGNYTLPTMSKPGYKFLAGL